MAGIVQNGQKRLIFIVVPQGRTKMLEKGKGEKNVRMDKSKENTNIYPYVYIHTYGHNKYIYTYSPIHIMCYSSQIVFFDIIIESV